MKKLQIKYNNIKQQWRKLRDRQKHDSSLAPANYPDWFEIINPLLSDTNQTMVNICSHPKDSHMFTENHPDVDDVETASEHEETLSDLAPANAKLLKRWGRPRNRGCTRYRYRNECAGFMYHTENTNFIGNARGNTKCTCWKYFRETPREKGCSQITTSSN